MTTNEVKVFIIHVAKEAESERFPKKKKNYSTSKPCAQKAINPLLLSFVCYMRQQALGLSTQIVCFEPLCDGTVYFDM